MCKCAFCNKDFIIKFNRKKFCSVLCQRKSHKKEKIIKVCDQCGKEFSILPSRSLKRFCSISCSHKKIVWNKGLLGYGRDWLQSEEMKQKRFLAVPRGEKSKFWKGGITSLVGLIRASHKSSEFNKRILIRDNFKCQHCGINENHLHVHHKKQFNIIFNEFLKEYSQFSPIEDKETLVRISESYIPFWDINNGKTLCKECHKKEHNLIGYK